MTRRTSFRIKCDSIAYRQGFIEVTSGIHEGCVNIEMWDIAADASLGDVTWVDDRAIPDSSIIANTEIELSTEQARSLAEALLVATNSIEQP